MKYRYQIRFHLGRDKDPVTGESRYMNWRIEDRQENTVSFYKQSKQFIFIDCYLRNRIGTAQKIYYGSSKAPCAWIECNQIIHETIGHEDTYAEVSYNPRKQPNWIFSDYEKAGYYVNADGWEFEELGTIGKKVYALYERTK